MQQNPHHEPAACTADTDTPTGRALWALCNSTPSDDAPDLTGDTIEFLLSIDIPLIS